jgi:hypothetical protein
MRSVRVLLAAGACGVRVLCIAELSGPLHRAANVSKPAAAAVPCIGSQHR